MSNIIEIPYNFKPRQYQIDLLRAIDSGYKRAIAVYHRRAGKDKTLWNLTIKKAFERVGVYYYFFPEFAQGKRVIWDGMDGSGYRFLDHLPSELVRKANSTDMKVELVNNSIIQIIGTDKFDKVRGSNPVGCVFSEFAFQNPKAWDIVRPILAENGGWAVFNSTPFGKNHFYDMFETAKSLPDWYTQLVTVEDSRDENGNRYVSEEVVEAERQAGMSEEMVQQEFYCSFTANAQGFYYLKYIEDADKEQRIGNVPYNPNYPVDLWWDIGFSDSTAIWFTQTINREICVIDFYQNNSQGLEHYAKYLQRLPYIYKSITFPHDIKKSEMGTGRSNLEIAYELFTGLDINVTQKLDIEDGIAAVRSILPMCVFDRNRCSLGLKALQNYHREWDEYRKEFKNKPVHDWSSHPSDAFRTLAVGLTIPQNKSIKESRIKSFRRLSARNWRLA